MEIDTGGTLQLNYPEVTGEVRLYGGTISGTGPLWGRSYDFQAGTLPCPLTGDFSLLTKSSTGTVTLSGNNSFSMGAVVNAGTLILTNSAGSATGSGNVTVNGGVLVNDGAVSGTTNVYSGAWPRATASTGR